MFFFIILAPGVVCCCCMKYLTRTSSIYNNNNKFSLHTSSYWSQMSQSRYIVYTPVDAGWKWAIVYLPVDHLQQFAHRRHARGMISHARSLEVNADPDKTAISKFD